MIRPDLVEYVKSQVAKGRNIEEIRNLLSGAGWQAQDIEDAIKAASGSDIPLPSYGGNSMYGNPSDYSNTSYLPGAGALLEEAWRIYKPRFKTFVGIIGVQIIATILLIAIMIVLSIVFSGVFSNHAFGAAKSSGFYMPPPPPPIPDRSDVFSNIMNWLLGFAAIFFLFGLPMLIIQIWGQAATIYAIKDSAEGIGVVEAYRRSWRKIGSLSWVGLLSLIIIFGGFMFFAIPGVIFAVWFSLASFIVITESVGGMDALLKSREYIKGRSWEVFGLLLVLVLLMVGISIGLQIGFGILGAIFSAIGLNFLSIILMLFNQAVWVFLTPITAIYLFLIYRRLREIKGDFAFTPSQGTKIGLLAIGAFGILAVIAIFAMPFLFLFAFSRIFF